MKYLQKNNIGLYFAVGLLVFQITCAAAVPQTVQLQEGSANAKLSLIFIPSGFTANNATIFNNEVAANLEKLWQNNFFADHRQRFDVFRKDGQSDNDGNLKTDSQILSLIKSYGHCTWGSDGTCKNIHIIIENDFGRNETREGFVRLKLNAKRHYTLAHELSVHVLGNLSFYHGPIMMDEYLSERHCKPTNYTYLVANAHDRNSNDKWQDLIGSPPAEGAAYCPFFFRPVADSIARAMKNRHCCPVGYKAAQIGLSKRTLDDKFHNDLTKPTVSLSVDEPETWSQHLEINVDAMDKSGIDRVELYVSIDGREYRSLGIDRNIPGRFFIDLASLNGNEFWFRIYVYDNTWVYWGFPDPGSQIGPFFKK